MNSRRFRVAGVLATGVAVTIFVSLGLFWARWACSIERASLLRQSALTATVDLSRLPGLKTDKDPNGFTPGLARARLRPLFLLAGLGFMQYVETLMPGTSGGRYSDIYRWDPRENGELLYYDRSLGLIVHQGSEDVVQADGTHSLRHFTDYAGPEGIAATPEENLGRFIAPLGDRCLLRPQVVYDQGVRRFFAVDWADHTVGKGPELPDDGTYRPVQLRVLSKNDPKAVSVLITPPFYVKLPSRPQEQPEVITPRTQPSWIMDRMLVLNASGRIDLLDARTLQFVGPAGWLPMPATVFDAPGQPRPQDVLAYEVVPIGMRPKDASRGEVYAGCAAAAVSREALALQLSLFDPNGQQVGGSTTSVPRYDVTADAKSLRVQSFVSTGSAAYFHLPSAQGLTVAKLALENLHPPIFLFLSYLGASDFDAAAGYRSLFLLPDSFVAMKARSGDGWLLSRLPGSMVFAFPAFVLVIVLAWWLDRSGRRAGLSKRERRAWVVGTIIFGLPACLTYCLTRRRATLVTCGNCGLGRRPDLEKCHRCGSPWVVPELTPPTWRVLGEGSPASLDWEARTTLPGAAGLQDETASQP